MKKKEIFFILVIVVVIIFALILNQKTKKLDLSEKLSTTPQINNSDIVYSMNKNGVLIDVLKEGSGIEAKVGDIVSVHYTGVLKDGTKFDFNLDRDIPFSFNLGAGEVIQGWDIGVEGMKIGEKRKLTIPSDLGYGANGVGDAIPPNSTLIFEVELLKIN